MQSTQGVTRLALPTAHMHVLHVVDGAVKSCCEVSEVSVNTLEHT